MRSRFLLSRRTDWVVLKQYCITGAKSKVRSPARTPHPSMSVSCTQRLLIHRNSPSIHENDLWLRHLSSNGYAIEVGELFGRQELTPTEMGSPLLTVTDLLKNQQCRPNPPTPTRTVDHPFLYKDVFMTSPPCPYSPRSTGHKTFHR